MKMKWYIWLIIIVVLAVIVVYFWTKNEKGKDSQQQDNAGASKNASTSKFPLRLGSSGTEVTNLQKYLNTRIDVWNYDGSYNNNVSKLKVTGIFDELTQTAVKLAFNGNTSVTENQYVTVVA